MCAYPRAGHARRTDAAYPRGIVAQSAFADKLAMITFVTILHIIYIPIRSLAKSLDKLPKDKSAAIVVYCAIGHRGGMGMMTLQLLGFTNVKSVAGGFTIFTASSHQIHDLCMSRAYNATCSRKIADYRRRPFMATSAVIKRKPKGLAALFKVQNVRHVIQLAFVAFIAFLVFQEALVGEGGTTVVTSAEAYCPFGGVETLYKFFTSGGATINHTHLSNVVLLIATVASALIFRSAFCSWVCPFGTLQEGIMALSAWLQRRFPQLKKVIKAAQAKARPGLLATLDRWLRYFKYVVLAWIVLATVSAGVMVFRDYDPYATLLKITEITLGPGLIILLVTLVASFFVERPWCRYACPLGAINGIVSQVSPFRLERNESLCTSCSICTRSCPVNLPVATSKKITSPECIGCLECVEACPRGGALELKLGLPFGK